MSVRQALSATTLCVVLVGCGGEGNSNPPNSGAGTSAGGAAGGSGGSSLGGSSLGGSAGSGLGGTSGSGLGGSSGAPGSGAKAIATPSLGTCVLDAAGEIHCWGLTGATWLVPAGSFVDLRAGAHLVCAIRQDRSYECFNEPYGHPDPIDYAPQVMAARLGVQESAICALDATGAPHCGVGPNYPGDLTPTAGLELEQVSVGFGFACGIAVADSSIQCWGKTPADATLCPGLAAAGMTTPPDGSFVALASADWASCALDAAGKIVCWGAGKPGDDANATCDVLHYNRGQSSPPPGNFVALSVGPYHGCAIKQDGTLACWGAGSADACTTSDDVECRQALPPSGKFKQLAVALNHSCGIDDAGKVHCWGYDGEGETAGRTQVPAEFR